MFIILVDPKSEGELLSIDPMKIVDHEQEGSKKEQKAQEAVNALTMLKHMAKDIKDDIDK